MNFVQCSSRTGAGSVLFLLLLCLSVSAVQAQDNEKRSIPDVQLKDVSGQTVNLAHYGANEKITILSFWATWCVPCKKELNNINYLIEEWATSYNAELVAISIDNARNASKVKPFAAGQNWSFEVLLDTNGQSKREFNFQTVPYTLVADQNGQIVYKHSGYVEGDEYELEEKLAELAGE